MLSIIKRAPRWLCLIGRQCGMVGECCFLSSTAVPHDERRIEVVRDDEIAGIRTLAGRDGDRIAATIYLSACRLIQYSTSVPASGGRTWVGCFPRPPLLGQGQAAQ